MNEKATEPVRKSSIDQVLPEPTRKLIETQPQNEVNRSLVLALLKVPIPESATTYEAIKDWIETTFDPRRIQRGAERSPVAIGVPVDYSDTEVGTCRYFANRTGQQHVEITGEQMEGIFQQADEDGVDSFERFLDFVSEELKEIASEEWPDMDTNNTDYDDYDNTDTRDTSIRLGNTAQGQLREQLSLWLQRFHRGYFDQG